jgi:hypothetical protein
MNGIVRARQRPGVDSYLEVAYNLVTDVIISSRM